MPLLGWKSRRIEKRFDDGLKNDKNALLTLLALQFSGDFKVNYGAECKIAMSIKPGQLTSGKFKTFDSVVLIAIAEQLPAFNAYDDDVWKKWLSDGNLNDIFKTKVIPSYSDLYMTTCRESDNFTAGGGGERGHAVTETRKTQFTTALEKQLKYESALAGGLQYLLKMQQFAALKNVFYNVDDNEEAAAAIVKALSATDPQDAYLSLDNLDPRDKSHIASVALSPISVVHLFRQYFFELDTFLGTPVGHVWLSPGSSVELVEVEHAQIGR